MFPMIKKTREPLEVMQLATWEKCWYVCDPASVTDLCPQANSPICFSPSQIDSSSFEKGRLPWSQLGEGPQRLAPSPSAPSPRARIGQDFPPEQKEIINYIITRNLGALRRSFYMYTVSWPEFQISWFPLSVSLQKQRTQIEWSGVWGRKTRRWQRGESRG